MKFVIVQIDDGGAQAWTVTDKAQVEQHLSSSQYWAEALKHFRSFDWSPGNAMDYPCGWLFSVHDHVEL